MKTAYKFHKAGSFIAFALLIVLGLIQQFFEIVDPAKFGEVGVLGYVLVGAAIAFIRAVRQDSLVPPVDYVSDVHATRDTRNAQRIK